jgi:hypothetical protein
MLQLLVDQLQHSDKQLLLDALYTLAMVMETEAIPLVTQLLQTESEFETQQTMRWVLEQLSAAHHQGYSTAAVMEQLYPRNAPDEKTAETEEKLKKVEAEMQQSQQRAKAKQHDSSGGLAETAIIGAASLAATGGRLLLVTLNSPSSGYNPELRGLQLVRQVIAQENGEIKRAVVPPRPANTDIKVWLRKLTAPEAKTRLSAIRNLGDFNNLRALGPLGRIFAHDPEMELRQTAQRIGIQMYLAALYWQNLSSTSE